MNYGVKYWFDMNVSFDPKEEETLEDLYENYVRSEDKENTKLITLRRRQFVFSLKQQLRNEMDIGQVDFVFDPKSTLRGVKLKKIDR